MIDIIQNEAWCSEGNTINDKKVKNILYKL